MSLDQFEQLFGAEVRDRYGRPEYILVPKHFAPGVGDAQRVYDPTDGDGRPQICLLKADGTDFAYSREYINSYGARGDRQTSATGSMIAGQTLLTDLSGPAFTKADEGKTLYFTGTGAAGIVLSTTIATYIDAGHVLTAAPAQTTIAAGGSYIWGTNNYSAIQKAIAANANAIVLRGKLRAEAGNYLVDDGKNGSASDYFTWQGQQLEIEGDGDDVTNFYIGQEGLVTTTATSNVFKVSANQSLTVYKASFIGPTLLGTNAGVSGGPPTDLVSWNSGRGGLQFSKQAGTDTASRTRLYHVHLKQMGGPQLSVGSIDVQHSLLEGNGNSYASMGIICGNDGSDGYNPAKFVHVGNSRLTGFGDAAGSNKYHHMYIGTSHDLAVWDSTLDTPASTATGNMAQHFDQNVPLAGAGQHASWDNVTFIPGTQAAVQTSYNCETQFSNCTLAGLVSGGIAGSGPVVINGTTFSIAGNSGTAFNTTTQGQSTGLSWSLKMGGGSHITYTGNFSASAISILNANAGDEFVIDATVIFDGVNNAGSGNYIAINAANARVDVAAKFFHHPNVAIRPQGVGCAVLNADGAKFLLSAGTSIFANGTAIALFQMHQAEFASGIGINMSTIPTVTDAYDNYGPGWAGVLRNVQNSAYAIKAYDELVLTNTTGGFTKILPAAASVAAGKVLRFKNTSGVADTISRNATPGTDTIDGATTVTIAATTGFHALMSNGTNGYDIVG